MLLWNQKVHYLRHKDHLTNGVCMYSIILHLISLSPSLILSSQLCLTLSCGLFHSDIPITILNEFIISLVSPTRLTHIPPLAFISLTL
jgi:hypothetical protein